MPRHAIEGVRCFCRFAYVRPALALAALLIAIFALHPEPAGAGARSGVRLVQRAEPGLPEPREESAAASLGKRLYLIAGFDLAGNDSDTVFVFDGKRWSSGPRLPQALDHPAAAVAGGRLYVVGGYRPAGATDATYLLSPNGRSWRLAARLHFARSALALVVVHSSLYALGGKDSNGNEIAAVEQYRPDSRTWRIVGKIPAPRDHLSGFGYNGWACAAGGRTPTTGRVDCFDPARRVWHRLLDLPTATSGAGAAFYGGEILVGGGELAGETAGIIPQLARFSGGKWQAGAMLTPRHGIEFAVYGGTVWACGGGIMPGLHPTTACTSIRLTKR